MSRSRKAIHIPLDCGRAELDAAAAVLRLVNSRGECYYRFKLSPNIEYLTGKSQERPVEQVGDESDGHFLFRGGDGLMEKEIHVQVRDGFIDYWLVATPVVKGAEINCVHYGQDGPGHESASAHRFEEFFIVCPDRYGSCIPAAGKVCFKLGVPSFRFDKDNNFPHEGGRTIIPPYFAALRTRDEWLGIGTMEIPTSEYGLNMTFQDGRAVTDFFYGGALKLEGEFAFPRITFFTRPDKLVAARTYIDRLYDDGLARTNESWDPSWAGPIYCFFSDQMYQYQIDRETAELAGETAMAERYCNDGFLEKCLKCLAAKAIPYKVIIIDYGWFVMNGQWRPNEKRFADFRATIRKLQSMGKKVLIWYSPYFNAEKSSNYLSHPEIAVKTRDGQPLSIIRLGSEVNYQSDFTHPAMRQLCRTDLRYMLGPDGLDADGLKLDCTHQPPTIENIFHDPAWGTGEMFHYKVSKFIYEEAKKIKPGCCINATAGNPLFNGTYDLHRIHDAMEYNLDAYEERAWAACLCRAGVADLDDWPSYDIFTVRANLRKVAYGSPSLYAARRRGGQRKIKAAAGYAVSVSDEELDLLSAIYELCLKAPADPQQEILIDPFRKIFHRKYADGKLKGFYAATTLSGNQALAVYDETAAHLVSISDIAVSVPLPPGAGDLKLSAVDRRGNTSDVGEYEIIDNELIFEARRCAGNLKCYRISYSLAKGSGSGAD